MSDKHLNGAGATKRILFVAGSGTEILDLVGPLQVFARASDMYLRDHPGAPPIYLVEVVSIAAGRSLIANCGLRFSANKTFRQVRGKIDTVLVAGGDVIEQNKMNRDAVRWLKKIKARTRRVGSVCTGAMFLARAGLLDGRRATTHWNWCDTLIRYAPRTDVDPDPIFVRDENIHLSGSHGWNGPSACLGGRRLWLATGSAGRS